MNIENSVSTLMSKYVKTLHPTDNLWDVKVLFDRFNIHHIPITEVKQLKGMISKSDFDHFVTGAFIEKEDRLAEKERLSAIPIETVMKKQVISIRSKDSIRLALEILRGNRFRALPVMDEEILVGIITPFDVLNEILNRQIYPSESNFGKNLSGKYK